MTFWLILEMENEMDYEIFGFRPKQLNKLKKHGYITLNADNHLFDILADRGVNYKLNIPRSKFHNTDVRLVTFEQAIKLLHNTEIEYESNDVSSRIGNDPVLILQYDKAYCKNPKYIRQYLLKQIGE